MRGLLCVGLAFLFISFLGTTIARAAPQMPVETLEQYFSRLAVAIDKSEAGRHPYGLKQYSRGIDEVKARAICITTIKGRYQVWVDKKAGGDFIVFLAQVYVPTEDDSIGQITWIKNVTYFMTMQNSLKTR